MKLAILRHREKKPRAYFQREPEKNYIGFDEKVGLKIKFTCFTFEQFTII